jgi:hypothetical protein
VVLRQSAASRIAIAILTARSAGSGQGTGSGLIHIIAGMMGAGVFERYPRLRVSFGESGAGWLADALHRMDFEFEDRFRDLMRRRLRARWDSGG